MHTNPTVSGVMNDPIKVVKLRIESLLTRSSEKELSKRKLGRRKNGIAVDEMREGLGRIKNYIDEISGDVSDHTLQRDTISRLADRSWGSEKLKRQQTSLKRTMTELSKATDVIDDLILVVQAQEEESAFTYKDVNNGSITKEAFYAQKSPAAALQARRDELTKSIKIVGELKEAIKFAKELKKGDETKERERVSSVISTLRTEVSNYVCQLKVRELVAKMAALPRMRFEPIQSLENLQKQGTTVHVQYLSNMRTRFINEVVDAIDNDFIQMPVQSGRNQPPAINRENIESYIDKECYGIGEIKKKFEYLEYIELIESAKAIQSAIKADAK